MDLLYSHQREILLESALVNSSQNCRTAKKEIIQWKSGSNGLLWALPNLIFTWHVTLQVPGLMFSHLCLVQGRDSAPGRLRSEITLSLRCFHLGSAKLTFVLVISSQLSQPSLSSFLSETKHLHEGWTLKHLKSISLSDRLPLESYRFSLDVSYSAAPIFIIHKNFTCLGFHILWAHTWVFFLFLFLN